MRGDRRQHPRGHHGAGHHGGIWSVGATGCNRRAANRFRRRTASAILTRGGYPDRAPVGVGVQRDRDVGRDVGGQGEQCVGGAGLLGVRERDGGEVGVRRELGADGVHVRRSRRAAASRRPPRRPPRAAGSGPPAPNRRRAAPRPRARCSARPDRSSAGSTGVRAIWSAERRGGHRGFDLAVGGRDDLDAAVEVHLVAVVGRRIVRGGDLYPGGGAGVAHRERHHRCGHRAGQ